MQDDDDLPPEAFPWREDTESRTERHRHRWGPSRKTGFNEGDRFGGQETFVALYNRLAARYGTAVTDGMIEGSIPPSDFLAMESRLRDDLDLWGEATGETRSLFLSEAERLALEAWLWEVHDRRRQDQRVKPKKSPDHDAPWRGAINWAPRRWFGPCPSGPPLQISIARAVGMRAQLEAEYSGEVRHAEGRGDGALTAEAALSRRNHPHPGGFFGPERGHWGPQTAPIKQRVVYQYEKDEQPPQSVLLQTHERPDERPD